MIKKDLVFFNDGEKIVWINEAKKWRLPYWDFALAENNGKVPDLFMPKSLKILIPGGSSESVMNPLFRYHLFVKNKLTKMGDLPYPYKVDNVKLSDGTILPVRIISLCRHNYH